MTTMMTLAEVLLMIIDLKESFDKSNFLINLLNDQFKIENELINTKSKISQRFNHIKF